MKQNSLIFRVLKLMKPGLLTNLLVLVLAALGSFTTCVAGPGGALSLAVSVAGDGPVRLSFPAELARRFQAECSDDLKAWTAVGEPVLGEGRTVVVLDDRKRSGVAGRWYRVRGLGSSVASDMAWIPAGTFTMGSPSDEAGRTDNEGPQTRVTISREYWLGQHEVTQGEFKGLMDYNPSWFDTDTNLPVDNVVWTEATNYCARLTERERSAGNLPRGYEYRLPTEAEWEYACRAGTTTATGLGASLSSTQANFDGGYPYGDALKWLYRERTTPVGKYAPNAWGLYDMHGNVYEWCRDWYTNRLDWDTNRLADGAVTDPQGPAEGKERVIRGGAWRSSGANCRSAHRASAVGWGANYGLGFRVALAPVAGYGQAVISGVLTMQPGGAPLAGATVRLLNQDLPADPANHGQAALVATAVTGPDGRYVFDHLLPGDYEVQPAANLGADEYQFSRDPQAVTSGIAVISGAQTVDFNTDDLSLIDAPPAIADPAQITRFFLTGLEVGQSATPGFVQAPFFFGGKVYAVSRPSTASLDRNRAIFSAGKIDGNGKYLYEKSFSLPVGDPQTAIFGTGERFTTCVYNGAVHLFYDVNFGANQLFKINHCSSAAPEQGWQNNGLVATSEDVLGAYSQLGAWRHTPLKAVTFNGRMYLVIGATEGRFLLLSTADGKRWDWVATLDDAKSWNDQFLPEMSACVVNRNGQQMLCVAIMGTRAYQDWTYFRFFDANNKLVGGYHQHMDWVSPHHGVGLAAGSVKGSLQGQVVQMFAQNSSWPLFSSPPRRCTMDVETGGFQDWTDTGSTTAARDQYIIPCDAVEATVAASGNGGRDVRKYIVLFNMAGLGPIGQYVDAIVYESDYFQANPVESRLNTADANTADPGCWSLVGVIEGLPPFTRNGNAGASALSEITYGRTQDSSLNYDVSFECEIFAKGNAGGKVPEVGEFGVGMTFKNLMSVASGYKVTLKTEGGNTWKSMADNQDGSLGYLLYAKPTLTSRQYTIYSQDRSKTLGAFAMVNISAVSIDPVAYALASPPLGMTARRPTTDLNYWQEGRGGLPVYDNQLIQLRDQSVSVEPSYDGSFGFTKTWENKQSISMKTTLEVSGKAKFALGLDVGGEVGLKSTLKLSTTTATSFGEQLKGRIYAVPAAAEGAADKVRKLTVNAAWYLPQDNVLLQTILNSGVRPYWIPEANIHQMQAPWLVTWKVLDVGR